MLRHQQALFMAHIGTPKTHRTNNTRMRILDVIYRNRKREPGGARGTMR
jgi:hypothetical protein